MKTRGGFQRRGLNTRGEKVNVGSAKIPRSTRNIRQPIRFMDDSGSEVSRDESTEEENWNCQECLNDDGVAADYIVCDTVNVGFTKKCVKRYELDIFSCKFRLEN